MDVGRDGAPDGNPGVAGLDGKKPAPWRAHAEHLAQRRPRLALENPPCLVEGEDAVEGSDVLHGGPGAEARGRIGIAATAYDANLLRAELLEVAIAVGPHQGLPAAGAAVEAHQLGFRRREATAAGVSAHLATPAGFTAATKVCWPTSHWTGGRRR